MNQLLCLCYWFVDVFHDEVDTSTFLPRFGFLPLWLPSLFGTLFEYVFSLFVASCANYDEADEDDDYSPCKLCLDIDPLALFVQPPPTPTTGRITTRRCPRRARLHLVVVQAHSYSACRHRHGDGCYTTLDAPTHVEDAVRTGKMGGAARVGADGGGWYCGCAVATGSTIAERNCSGLLFVCRCVGVQPICT